MKKIGKLKLNELNKKEIEHKRMVFLKGGYGCECKMSCECNDPPPGGISNAANNAEVMSQFRLDNYYV
jgi:natural product precursor